MKTSVLFLLFSIGAIAQTSTVTGTITDPGGDLISGQCVIQALEPFTAAAGWRVVGAPMTVSFTAGAFSAALAPTDSATPSGQNYKVNCAVPRQVVSGRTIGPYNWGPQYWLVPTGGSPLDISAVEVSTPPPGPSLSVLWAQLPPPPSSGTFCVESIAAVIGWDSCSSGGGGGGGGAVSSIFGRIGAVAANSGDYNTSLVTESGSLYFTNARAQAAMAGLYQAPITGAPGTWPTIPAAQVNSNWNASSGLAQILNKPTIPAAQVNSDWNASSGLAQILNKPTFPSAVTGTPGYLYTNGTTASWGNIVTGGSMALDCATVPGQCDVTSIVPLKGTPNTWTGANDFTNALLSFPKKTIGTLPPASSNSGREFTVTDGASTCDTTIGGGSTRVLVESNGTSYVAPNCLTGGGAGASPTTSPGFLGGRPSLYANSSQTFTSLLTRVWPITDYVTANSLNIYIYGTATSGAHIVMAFYDHTGTLLCQTQSIATASAALSVTFASPCTSDPVGGYVSVATTDTAITLMTDESNMAGITNQYFTDSGAATVGTAASATGSSTITMPSSLGTITAVDFQRPTIFRR